MSDEVPTTKTEDSTKSLEFDLRDLQSTKNVPKITSILKTYYQHSWESEPFESVQLCQLELGEREEEEPFTRTLRFKKGKLDSKLDLGWFQEEPISLAILTANKDNQSPIRVEIEIKSEWGTLTNLPPGTSTMLYRDSYSDLRVSGSESDKLGLILLPG